MNGGMLSRISGLQVIIISVMLHTAKTFMGTRIQPCSKIPRAIAAMCSKVYLMPKMTFSQGARSWIFKHQTNRCYSKHPDSVNLHALAWQGMRFGIKLLATKYECHTVDAIDIYFPDDWEFPGSSSIACIIVGWLPCPVTSVCEISFQGKHTTISLQEPHLPHKNPMPVGPQNLWAVATRKSAPRACTSIARCGTACDASSSTFAPTYKSVTHEW